MALSETPEGEEQDLHRLHGLHIQYMQDMRQASSPGLKPYLQPRGEFDDFAEWWAGLRPNVRAMLSTDYRVGYAQAVAEGDQQVADNIKGVRNRLRGRTLGAD